MDWEEASRRFMAREPVEGVAFLLNDSVEVTNGPHRGSTGAVIALRTLSHDPIYVVELASGQDVELSQADVVCVEYANALVELQRWYSARCNGDWEHSFGITICTLDNPGWSVSIQLTGTVLAQAGFVEVKLLEPVREWIHCRVEQQRFEGRGGPHMLGRIIRTFLQWAESIPNGAA